MFCGVAGLLIGLGVWFGVLGFALALCLRVVVGVCIVGVCYLEFVVGLLFG